MPVGAGRRRSARIKNLTEKDEKEQKNDEEEKGDLDQIEENQVRFSLKTRFLENMKFLIKGYKALNFCFY